VRSAADYSFAMQLNKFNIAAPSAVIAGDSSSGRADIELLRGKRRGNLSVLATASLLVADVVGTGILALPGEVAVIGGGGLLFLVLQFPLNMYIGSLLNAAADRTDQCNQQSGETANLVSLSASLFGSSAAVTLATRAAYILNLFLVLGNYLVVMSNAVGAMLGPEHRLCQYQSTLVATSLLLGLNQLPSLADIGRWPTVVSIASVVAVLMLCLVGSNSEPQPISSTGGGSNGSGTSAIASDGAHGWMATGTALSGIIFASASQKLLLNIRTEVYALARICCC